MKKVLFVIHNMEEGGAQRVLVNLVNNMNPAKFEISVLALFGGGVNEALLSPHIHYRAVFKHAVRGNRILFKLFSPEALYRFCIRDQYDIVISYLEGITARIVSGCPYKNTKLISWIHVQQNNMGTLSNTFRNEKEATVCYHRFHQTVCVSDYVRKDFCGILDFRKPCRVLYNTVESDKILLASAEPTDELLCNKRLKMIAVGTLKESKGYDRLLHIMTRMKKNRSSVHLYILGVGPMERWIKEYIRNNDLSDMVTLLGYRTNPYKYVAKCDLFVCASHAEGFSTAATESLIVGTPVCTVEVSGMKEMLGENNEYGIVTENNEDSLYEGIKKLIDDPQLLQHYATQSSIRGKAFSTTETVQAVESMLLSLS